MIWIWYKFCIIITFYQFTHHMICTSVPRVTSVAYLGLRHQSCSLPMLHSLNRGRPVGRFPTTTRHRSREPLIMSMRQGVELIGCSLQSNLWTHFWVRPKIPCEGSRDKILFTLSPAPDLLEMYCPSGRVLYKNIFQRTRAHLFECENLQIRQVLFFSFLHLCRHLE